MRIGINIGLPGFLKSGGAFSPSELFASGEQGAWYDPSDYSTLFQDAAGTTPVTAVEQPVGLMLDRRKQTGIDPILQKYGSLPGTSGNYFNTPDSAANSITGDIDIRVLAALTDWTPSSDSSLVAKFNSGTNNRSYLFRVLTTGVLQFLTNPVGNLGASNVVYNSTVAPTVANGAILWVRVTLDVDNGASGKTATFYTSADGTTWTQLGDPVTSAGTTSIFDGAAPLEVGSSSGGGADLLTGQIYRAQIFNGINGTKVVDFCPPYGWSSGTWTAPTNEVWTVNGTATVVSLTTAGNHAYQTTSASRPTLSARVNLLTKTEQFDDAAVWTVDSGSVTANTTIAPNGTTTADSFFENTLNAAHGIGINYPVVANVTYRFSICLKQLNGREGVTLRFGAASDSSSLGTYIGAATILFSNGSFTGSGVTVVSATDIGNGFYRCVIETSTSAAFLSIRFWSWNGSAVTFVGDITKGFIVWGADLRVANDGVGIPAYQRVNTSTDYDTSGFPTFLRFDGSDDSMLTNSVDFTATDKMTVWAGVRKLSDAANGMVVELSAQSSSNNGSFAYSVASSGANSFWRSIGTLSASGAATGTPAAPASIVATGIGNIGGDVSQLYENRVLTFNSTADQGTGNYGNYPLYIGRRNNATLPLDGRIYSLIVRGAASTAAQIASTESWVNGKTKAY